MLQAVSSARTRPGDAAAGRQRQIQVVAMARAFAAFIGMAQIERVFVARIGVDGDEQHIVAVVEDALRAVAVVVVEIEDGDAARAVVEHVLRASAALRKQ
jgi:hypothetical protein